MPGSGDPFVEQLYLSLKALVQDQRSLILAVSGGADSLALLHGATRLSDRLRARLRVVTIDHGLLASSGDDARFVVETAKRLGLSAEVRRLKMKGGAAVEERARELRYAALEVARKKGRFAWVATAHTASDQAETLLQRLSRGAALLGAGSILARRDRVIRPLLFATRPQVRAWLVRQDVKWIDDPMNDEQSLMRVRMRKNVMPVLEAASDSKVSLRLARFARFASDDDAHLQAEADVAYARLARAADRLDSGGLKKLPVPIARRVLARFLKENDLPVDGELVERMRAAVAASGTATLPKRRLLQCRRGNATIVIE